MKMHDDENVPLSVVFGKQTLSLKDNDDLPLSVVFGKQTISLKDNDDLPLSVVFGKQTLSLKDNDDLPLSIVLGKPIFSIQEDSAKCRSTEINPILLKSLDKGSETRVCSTMSNELNFEGFKIQDLSQKESTELLLRKRFLAFCESTFQSVKIQSLKCQKESTGLEFRKHLQRTSKWTNLFKFKCPKHWCYEYFSCKKSLDAHVEFHEHFKCSFCDKVYFTKTSLSSHVNSVHEKKRIYNYFKSPPCIYTRKDRKPLNLHKQTVHINAVHMKTFSCLHCSYVCKQKSRLNRHMYLVHKNIKPFKCSVCIYAGRTKVNLLKHKKSKHKRGDEKKESTEKGEQEPIENVKQELADEVEQEPTEEGKQEAIFERKHEQNFEGGQEQIKAIKLETFKEEFMPPWSDRYAIMSELIQEIKTEEFFGENEDAKLLAYTESNQIEFEDINLKIGHLESEMEKCQYVSSQPILESVPKRTIFYTCPKSECGETFISMESMDAHLKHHEQFKCSYCDKVFLNKNSLSSHVHSCHIIKTRPKYLKCPYCFYATINRKYLIIHKRTAHVDDKFKCSYCDKRFGYYPNLKSHKRLVHEKPQCPHCVYATSDIRSLKHHIRTVHEQLKCLKDCHLCFRYTYNYETRKRKRDALEGLSHTVPKGTIFYTCPKSECGETFINMESMDAHVKYHEQYKCSLCDKVYLDKNSLSSHVHSYHIRKSKPKCLKCPYCFYVAINRNYLILHKRKAHVDEKFKCSYCDKRFRYYPNLKSHIRLVHEKPQCPHCVYATSDIRSLKHHIRTVHEQLKCLKDCHLCFRYNYETRKRKRDALEGPSHTVHVIFY